MNLDAAPKWHYLTHNSRILKPSTLLTAVLKHPGEEVVYIRPVRYDPFPLHTPQRVLKMAVQREMER